MIVHPTHLCVCVCVSRCLTGVCLYVDLFTLLFKMLYTGHKLELVVLALKLFFIVVLILYVYRHAGQVLEVLGSWSSSSRRRLCCSKFYRSDGWSVGFVLGRRSLVFLWGCFLLIGQTDAPETSWQRAVDNAGGGRRGWFENDIEERSAGSSVPDSPAPPSQGGIDFISVLTSIWAAGAQWLQLEHVEVKLTQQFNVGLWKMISRNK